MAMTLGEIAVRFGLELAGDPALAVDGVGALAAAGPGKLTFCTGAKYRKELARTAATAVVLTRELAPECPVAALVSPRPYAAYARIAQALHPLPAVAGGRAPGAQVAPTAEVPASAWVGPNAVIGENPHPPPQIVEHAIHLSASLRDVVFFAEFINFLGSH